MTVILAFYTLSAYSPRKYDRGMADVWYLYAGSSFIFGVVFAGLGYTSARNQEKKNLTLVLLIVNVIAMCTYFLQYFRLTPSMRGARGMPVDPCRYLEWIACCPVLIHLIAEISGKSAVALDLVKQDYALVILGFTASLMKEPFAGIFGAFSCIYCYNVVRGLYAMYQSGIQSEDVQLDKMSLKTAQAATCLAWTACKSFHYL